MRVDVEFVLVFSAAKHCCLISLVSWGLVWSSSLDGLNTQVFGLLGKA